MLYGANNQFNRSAFGVLSASARVAISKRSWLQISGDNLTNAYAQPYEDYFGGVPVPLVNGKLGVTDGSNVGPMTLRFSYHRALGSR
jgi:hypothetical protein